MSMVRSDHDSLYAMLYAVRIHILAVVGLSVGSDK